MTRSKLVHADIGGNQIADVVRNGRIEKRMPAFTFSTQELNALVAFIHAAEAKAALVKPGARRGVDVADLQTGDREEGKRYFNGAGGCAKCHSATGDLAGVATRYEGCSLKNACSTPATSRATPGLRCLRARSSPERWRIKMSSRLPCATAMVSIAPGSCKR